MANVKSRIIGFCAGAAVFNVLGLLVHGANELVFDTDESHTIGHRFENAYCFSVSDDHKYYTRARYKSDDTITAEQYMLHSPWVTYPLLLAFGALGADFAAEEERIRRYEKDYRPKQR